MDYITIDLGSTALVTIDLQNGFVDGVAPVPGIAEVLPSWVRLLNAFRKVDKPIARFI